MLAAFSSCSAAEPSEWSMSSPSTIQHVRRRIGLAYRHHRNETMGFGFAWR